MVNILPFKPGLAWKKIGFDFKFNFKVTHTINEIGEVISKRKKAKIKSKKGLIKLKYIFIGLPRNSGQ